MTTPRQAASRFDVPWQGETTCRVEHYVGRPRVKLHYHPAFELTLIRGCAGKLIVGDHQSSFSGRDLILAGPNLPHAWACHPAPGPGAKEDFSVVLFSRESIGYQVLEKPEFRGIAALLEKAARGVRFSRSAVREVEPLFDELRRSAGMDRFIAFLRLLDALSAQRDSAALVSADYRPARSEADFAAFARVVAFLHAKSEDAPSLKEAAAHIDTSVPTFTRLFRRMTGTTFIVYLNQWRIDRACTLLQETDSPVLDVSLTVGFNNLSHFNRQFRRIAGMTPREYRRLRGTARDSAVAVRPAGNRGAGRRQPTPESRPRRSAAHRVCRQ
jgi:AraC-like DNA-binding protein